MPVRQIEIGATESPTKMPTLHAAQALSLPHQHNTPTTEHKQEHTLAVVSSMMTQVERFFRVCGLVRMGMAGHPFSYHISYTDALYIPKGGKKSMAVLCISCENFRLTNQSLSFTQSNTCKVLRPYGTQHDTIQVIFSIFIISGLLHNAGHLCEGLLQGIGARTDEDVDRVRGIEASGRWTIAHRPEGWPG